MHQSQQKTGRKNCWKTQGATCVCNHIHKDKAQVCLVEEHNLGQLSRQLLQPPVGSNTDVGETQTRYQSVATLNGLKQY